ncbi:circadian clock-controlled protein daywake [Drosophila virilis]|uniref:Uncharacterized protein, isoform A n=1 Tax=Drosophila virilis TaxID=7244 RepID=A0A0Q9WDJ2_DROVI|nr:protein takeout [Drosophila virilis]KRF78987.1 uncharacterized protein Dvir_GJ27084, isoform A [Drosophila virilis]
MSKMWYTLALLLLNGFFVRGELPPEIEKCAGGDANCIVETINQIVQKYPKGLPGIGLDALDAIDFQDVVVSEATPNTPMQLSLKFNTLRVCGFENTTIQHVKGFEKVLRHGFELAGWTPLLRLDGLYEAEGRLLMLPIQGKGVAQVELSGCQFTCRAKAVEDQRTADAKLYAKINKVKCLVNIKGLHVNFDKLLDNQELSDSMNELINNNWQDVWNTMRKGVNSAVNQVAQTIISRVLDKLPYDDFYKQVL